MPTFGGDSEVLLGEEGDGCAAGRVVGDHVGGDRVAIQQ